MYNQIRRNQGAVVTLWCENRVGVLKVVHERPHLLARLCNGESFCMRQSECRTGRGDSDLSTLFLKSVEDSLERRGFKAAVNSSLPVILESETQPLGAIVECITKRFVNALERVAASHKDLTTISWNGLLKHDVAVYSFKSRGACPRMCSNEDGFIGHLCCATTIEINRALINSWKANGAISIWFQQILV
jgi:hypothetical protein